MKIYSRMSFFLCVFDFGFSHLCIQVKLEGDISQGVAYYKKALYYNWHYADAMYNLGVAYGEMLKFEMVSDLWEFYHVLVLHLNVCSSPAMRFSKFTAACKQS